MKYLLVGLVAVLAAVLVVPSAEACYGEHCGSVTSTKTRHLIPATASCPDGYELIAGQCVRSKLTQVTAEKTYSCPPNYYLINNRCESTSGKTIYIAPNTTCPAGAVLRNGMCVVDVVDRCPHGFKFDGLQCTKIMPVCSSGYYLQNDMCWPINPQPPIHPPVYRPPVYQHSYPCGQPPCVQQPCMTPSCQTGPQVVPVRPITPISPSMFTPPSAPNRLTRPSIVCPHHYQYDGYRCIRVINDTITVPPQSRCPEGYSLDEYGECVKATTSTITIPPQLSCPEGYIMQGNGCYKETIIDRPVPCVSSTCPPTRIEMPTNGPSPDQTRRMSFASSINNHVPINVTTNTISNNNHPVTIHMTGSASSKPTDCKTSTVAEPHRITCEPVPVIEISEPQPSPSPPCCKVVSPRICRRQERNDWNCYHRQTQQCGHFCTQPRMYLRPEQPVFRPRLAVMPPMPRPIYPVPRQNGKTDTRPKSGAWPPITTYHRQYAITGICPTGVMYSPGGRGQRSIMNFLRFNVDHLFVTDCSQCGYGVCPSYCGQYDCQGSCNYVSQRSFCSENGGNACTQDFGCMDGDFCS